MKSIDMVIKFITILQNYNIYKKNYTVNFLKFDILYTVPCYADIVYNVLTNYYYILFIIFEIKSGPHQN